ncbi:MAG: ATP-binding protein [Leptospiraceae bacterium]|nr:ATP-binding protein [Leptospiraceae bacterium]
MNLKTSYTLLSKLKLVLIIFLSSFSLELMSIPVLSLNDSSNEFIGCFEFYEEKEQILFKEVLNVGTENWTLIQDCNYSNLGHKKSPYWFRIEIENKQKIDKEIYFELKFPLLDLIELYYLNESGQFKKIVSGDFFPFHTREIGVKNFLFKIPFFENKNQLLYVRIKTDSQVSLSHRFWKVNGVIENSYNENLFHGIYFGMLFAAFIFNAFLSIAFRERTLYLYSAFLVISAFSTSILFGFSMKYLWPEFPLLNEFSPLILNFGYIVFNSFTSTYLDLKHEIKLLDKILKILSFLSISILIVFIFIGYRQSVIILNWLVLSTTVLYTYAGIKLSLRKNINAYFYLLGFGFYFLGTLIVPLAILGFLPRNFFIPYGIQISFLFQIIVLSSSFGYRVFLVKRKEEMNEKTLIEEQKKSIEALKRIDVLKEEFLVNTSHELKTPLHGIIGISESILSDTSGKITELTKKNLELIISSAFRLSNLINDILDFSQINSNSILLEKKALDLSSIVEFTFAILNPLAKPKHLKLLNLIPPDFPRALGDENRIGQVMLNLVGNAIKFTEEGEVKVEGKIINSNRVLVSIIDTGIGIPTEKQKIIFERFTQLEFETTRVYGGTGLGLSISKKLIEIHGGELIVRSELGAGSCFSFDLEISNSDFSNIKPNLKNFYPTIESKNLITDKFSQQKTRILIVEDEPIIMSLIEGHLQIENYFLYKAYDGIEAKKILDSNLPKPDLILLDIMLPKMNGYEFCRYVRKTYSGNEIPIIMLTARNSMNDLVLAFEYGANDYISKPFSRNELNARIKSHIELKKLYEKLEEKVKEKTTDFLKQKEIAIKANQMKDKYLTIVSHDLKSGVLNVRNLLTMLVENFHNVGEVDKIRYLSEGKIALENSYQFVKNLLDLNRFESGMIEPKLSYLNFYDIIEKVTLSLKFLMEAKNIKLVKTIDEHMIFLGDENLLFQVFNNLINNSIKFSENNSSIEIKIERTNEGYQVLVKDHGIGISNETLEELNKGSSIPSTLGTQLEVGSGIGLGIVSEIVKLHNGEMIVRSQKNLGTEVLIQFTYFDELAIIELDKPEEISNIRKKLFQEKIFSIFSRNSIETLDLLLRFIPNHLYISDNNLSKVERIQELQNANPELIALKIHFLFDNSK